MVQDSKSCSTAFMSNAYGVGNSLMVYDSSINGADSSRVTGYLAKSYNSVCDRIFIP